MADLLPNQDTPTMRILASVHAERERQEDLRLAGKFADTAASATLSDFGKLAILVEEVGEVARELNDDGARCKLRAELIQVAAVAVAWCEALDAGGGGPWLIRS